MSTELEEFPDQLTWVTARVPESTMTTGRTRASERPIRRAGPPRPLRVRWVVEWFAECFTRERVACSNEPATMSHPYGGWSFAPFRVGR